MPRISHHFPEISNNIFGIFRTDMDSQFFLIYSNKVTANLLVSRTRTVASIKRVTVFVAFDSNKKGFPIFRSTSGVRATYGNKGQKSKNVYLFSIAELNSVKKAILELPAKNSF